MSNQQSVVIDLKRWFGKLLQYWWIFLISILITVGSGQIYLRYAVNKYQAKAKLLIEGASRGTELSGLGIVAGDFGISGGSKDLSNETEILYSRPIIASAIEKIDAHISYYRIGNIKSTELYKSAPFIVSFYRFDSLFQRGSFLIEIGYNDVFNIKSGNEDETRIFKYGQRIKLPFGTLVISQNERGKLVPGLYEVFIANPEDLASNYKSRLEIEVVGGSSSSIIELKFQDPVREKARLFLKSLIDTYNEAEVEENTEVLTSTIDFIEERIEVIADELDNLESEIEQFKSKYEIITQTASASSGYVLSELRATISELSTDQMKIEMLDILRKRLLNYKNSDELIPSNVLGIDANLETLISEYNSLLIQRQKLLETLTIKSPSVSSIDKEMSQLSDLMLATIDQLKEDVSIPIQQKQEKIEELESDLKAIPSIEKELVEKLRMQSIKEDLFLFLLQKREQTELSKAIYKADTRLIEPPRSSYGPVFPRKDLVRIGSVSLGFVFPFLLITLIFLFKTTIESEEELREKTDIPILGRIPTYKSKNNLLIDDSKRSIRMEMFRLLRTNLDYLNVGVKQQTVAVTSLMSGDGKSVTALNLALSLGMTSKSVVIVDFDLRKPRVAEYLGIDNSKGVTNLLVHDTSIDEVIKPVTGVDNLSVITSGPVPPDAAELLLSEKKSALINELKKRFDYVILDMPPVGVVSDALVVQRDVNNTILVIRMRYTKMAMINFLEELNQKGQLSRPSLVLNAVKTGNSSGYGGYYAKAGQGYYEE